MQRNESILPFCYAKRTFAAVFCAAAFAFQITCVAMISSIYELYLFVGTISARVSIGVSWKDFHTDARM